MIRSMTGFGKSTVEIDEKSISIELKSLNSKQLDLNVRIPNNFRQYEAEIRSMIKNVLERGKVDFNIYYENNNSKDLSNLNRDLFKHYFDELKSAYSYLGIVCDDDNIVNNVMRLPDLWDVTVNEDSDEVWVLLKGAIEKSLSEINNFREQEGKVLIEDIKNRVANILVLLKDVEKYEGRRAENVKQKLKEKLEACDDIQSIDQNRLEQEIIYYVEKFDITEEKVRLENHCSYFVKTSEGDNMPGRKLGFIAQEMGREINTLGSKANDSDIQRIVVNMKDELEKIKEQLLNIL